ncbi:F-box/FBD/LRR-repeat protein At4g26340-like [Lotus japonicus]|uniref:F-box/FBD/LRR-repeat protein At4g26340-like n=1 Tax=Lotus japonicus TaxID=34305 RepID=UPI00258738C5|nr:F-box/FBD/LRR-repeat protein At4g26340-like [Lotus japonicus]
MKKINISEGVDRISELSDEVLGHILSLLPSKETIATCLLSKRWRYVWKLVSALDFVCLPDMTIKALTKVSEFLRLCGTKRIRRFHVKCKSHIHQCWQPWNDLDLEGNTGPCCLYHIQEFVDAAIAGKVEQLSISMPQHRNGNHEPLFMSQHRNHEPPLFFVPTNLFNSATIVSLKLEGPFILLVPSCIQLPSLKSLHLSVRKCEPSLKKFLSGIPSLEVFSLKQVDSDFSL